MLRIYSFLFAFLCISTGLQAQNDLRIKAVYPVDYMMPGTLHFTIIATYTAPTSTNHYMVGWQVDNGPIKTWLPSATDLNDYITTVGMKQMDADSFKVTVTATGTHQLKVWLKLTTLTDAAPANDTMVKTLKVLPYLPPKQVVMETHKHEHCGPCYPAANFLHAYMQSKPDFSIINCYGINTDQIYTPEADTINTTYLTAHPETLYDRFMFPFRNEIYVDYVGSSSTMTVPDDTGERKKFLEPLEVKFGQVSFNQATLLLKVQLKAKVYDTLTGDYRFNLFLTEDSVKAYQTDAPDPNNYYHQSVLRRMTGGPWGQAGSMPAPKLIAGQEYTYDFQYQLPATWNPAKMHLTGLVQKYNAADIFDRRILNSCNARLYTAATLGVAATNTRAMLTVGPNPVTNDLTIAAPAGQGGVVTITDGMGKLVQSLSLRSGGSLSINTAGWPTGVYFVRFANGLANQSYEVMKIK